MNILYISALTAKISEGPNYSVPSQVTAQKEYDNVFLWNQNTVVQSWWKDTGVFYNLNDYSCKNIADLPAPFCTPDLVVFEGYYHGYEIRFSRECRKRGIPYIIIPRSCFTKRGQNRKRIKKLVANALLFKGIAKKAMAIHYLTENEYLESGKKWNKKFFVIPNGTNKQTNTKNQFSDNGLKGVYIGRFEPYQKGLDILLEAVEKTKNTLVKNNVTITLYGPERKGRRSEFIELVNKMDLNSVITVEDGVFGNDKEKVLLSADFFIMTSRFEGMPMALIEAMGYGLPCLVSSGTNMADVIKASSSGWTYDGTAEGLVGALQILIRDKNSLDVYSKNALNESEKYHWDNIAKITHEQYQKLLGNIKE